jgi:hypothetical protein
LRIGCLLLPLKHEFGKQRMKGHRTLRSFALSASRFGRTSRSDVHESLRLRN